MKRFVSVSRRRALRQDHRRRRLLRALKMARTHMDRAAFGTEDAS